MRARFAVGLAVVLAGVMAASQPALAAPTWLAPTPVSSSADGALSVRVIAESGGGVVVAWSRVVSGNFQTVYSHRPPGGPFGPPVPISPADESWVLRDMAGNARGDALMVMESFDAGSGIGLAVRTAGGAFSPLDEISDNGFGQEAEAAVGADGTMAAIWQREDPAGDIRAELSVRLAGHALFSLPAFASAPMVEETSDTALAIGPDGTVVALWREQHAANIFEYFAAALAPGETTVVSPQRVSLDDEIALGEPALEVAGDGTAIAIWEQRVASVDSIYHAVRPPGGPFDPAEPLSAAGIAGGMQVAVDAAGNALAAWDRSTGPPGQVEASFRPAGGDFGSVQTIGPAGSVEPGAAFGGDGSAIIVWRSTAHGRIEAARRAPGAALFGAPVPAVADNGESPEFGSPQASPLAMDAQGNAVLGFNRGSRAQAAGFDAAGPTLSGLSIPAAGARAAELPFAVSVSDVWSPISTTWAFGDGQSAAGASVSHTYATTGAFSASVTATDAVGNATTAGGQVAVTDTLAPAVAIAFPPGQRLRRVLRRGLRVRVGANEAGLALVDALVDRRLLRRPSGSALARVGRTRRALQASQTATLTIGLSRKARSRLARARRVRLTVRVSVTDASGNRGLATRRVTLRR